MRLRYFLLATFWLYGSLAMAEAKIPVRQFTLGWGVDVSNTNQREIAAVLEEYLTSPDSAVRESGTTLWCEAEQSKRQQFDLTALWVYKGVHATLLEVTPLAEDSREYWVKTLYTATDRGGVQPLGLQRLLARREKDHWVLCGAIDRLTSGWQRKSVGGITYHFSDTWGFDRQRAELASAFVDSVAEKFGVNQTGTIDYFLAQTPEALAQTIGLDWTIPGVHGRTYSSDKLIFVGDTVQGEAYLHELVHTFTHQKMPTLGWFKR